jgi:superfamily II DNA or RNA helicase
MQVPSRAGAAAGVCLRPYQTDTIDRLDAAVARGARRVLVVAPTGAGKCVTRETLVWSRGLRSFGEAWGADRIEGPCGAAEVRGWYDDGARDGLEITLACGLVLDGTSHHRVWVRDADGGEGWRRLADLQIGDRVGVARGHADFGETSIPLDEAYALGVAIADGCIVGAQLRIDKQAPLIDRIRPVVERWHALAGAGAVPSRTVEISPRHTAIFSCGNWQASDARTVPSTVRTGHREVVRAFLRGYFDGDGYCDHRPGVSTSSSRLADEVHQLLLGLGVAAHRRRKETTHLPAHVLSIVDFGAFAREIGFTPYGLTKDTSFASLLARVRNTNVDTIPGVGALLRRAAKWVPNRTRREDGWRHLSAYFDGRKRPGYSALASLLPALPQDCPERAELLRLITEHRLWSPVAQIAPSRRRRIDCEVAAQHAFVGNGIINHNTTIAGSVIERAARQNRRVLFLAHRRELISQAYRRLLDFGLPERDVGVIMANDPRRRPVAPVQVASVDTLRTRAKPHADVVFIDEAHRALARTYVDLLAAYPEALHIGLTATPYRADGQGLGDAYDELIVIASPRELIAQGHLVEPRVFTVPASQRPDLSGVNVSRGDYAASELAEAVDRQALVGNIVEHWMTHARGVRTVAFAASVEHSQHIAARFREAGVAAEHLDGGTPTIERDAILARLDRGETLVVSNCGVLCEGWDQPAVKCAILARPTKSTGLYLQQGGRILRPWNDQRAIILDHAGCALEHGLPQDDREFSLEGTKKRTKATAEAPARECPTCFAVVGIATRVCPECGHEFFAEREVPREEDGALEEVTSVPARTRSPPSTGGDRSVRDAIRAAARAGGRLSWAALDAARVP